MFLLTNTLVFALFYGLQNIAIDIWCTFHLSSFCIFPPFLSQMTHFSRHFFVRTLFVPDDSFLLIWIFPRFLLLPWDIFLLWLVTSLYEGSKKITINSDVESVFRKITILSWPYAFASYLDRIHIPIFSCVAKYRVKMKLCERLTLLDIRLFFSRFPGIFALHVPRSLEAAFCWWHRFGSRVFDAQGFHDVSKVLKSLYVTKSCQSNRSLVGFTRNHSQASHLNPLQESDFPVRWTTPKLAAGARYGHT